MNLLNILQCSVLIFTLKLDTFSTQIAHYGIKAANKCFSVVGVPQLDFDQCNQDEMIQIVDAVQGIGQKPGQCIYKHKDCVEVLTKDTEDKLATSCVGQPHCGITVSVAWMSKCRAYSSYNYALYKCIPKSDIIDICEKSEKKTRRNAYLMSPGYPDRYPGSVECVCNITTEIDQRILLTFADFDLEWSENCERDILQISDGTTRMPRCGRLARNYNITSRTHQLQVTFRTDDWQQQKGFWLQVEALGSLDMACGPKHFTTTTTSTSTSTTTTPVPSTNSQLDATLLWFSSSNDLYMHKPTDNGRLNGQSSNRFDRFGSSSMSRKTSEILFLVGIIVGCILIAVIVIIVVFLIIWVKRRRHKESISHIPAEAYYPKKRAFGDHSPRPESPNSAGSVLSQGSDTDSARHNRSRNGTPKPHKSKN